MGKIIGLLLTLGCLWVGLEVYNNGVHGAFGGRIAFLDEAGMDEAGSAEPLHVRRAPQRAGDAVDRAHAEATARREKLLGE